MKYLGAISYNTLIIGVHLCWMRVWTCFLVEKSQCLASLSSLWVFLYICKYLDSNSIQVAEFCDICRFRGRKPWEWYFFPQRYLMFNVGFPAKKMVLLEVFIGCQLSGMMFLPSGSRCSMWKTCKLVCLLWPSTAWAVLPFQLSQTDEVLVTCVLSTTRDFK